VPNTQPVAVEYPELGNTPETDRLLLREIGDSYIYDPTVTTRQQSELDAQMETVIAPLAVFEPTEKEPQTWSTWDSIRQSRRIDIPDHERVEHYRREYRQEALWMTKILDRGTPFIGHIVDALDERYLPMELALIPAIESGYRPNVQSGQYAVGLWQFVPITATDIGIKRTVWFDGRADIRQSTVAAMDYLSYLNAEFHGNWLHTLAAYNAGPGRVRAAIRSNEKKNLPTDFWSLPLPPETQDYVPKFLALLAMIRHDELNDFVIPHVERGDGFDTIDLGRRASIDKIAILSGIEESVLRTLNAGLVHGVTPPEGPHTFNVWKGQGDVLADSVADANPSELYTLPATYTVVAGDTISGIAEKYGLSQRRLRSMNALETSKILIGQKLAVRKNADPLGGDIEYVVSIGDTLSAIAEKFSVRLIHIFDAEGQALTSDLIHPGVKLTISIEEPNTG